jgi:hypothetical protein
MEDHLLNTPGVSASAFSLSSGFGSGLVDSVDGDDGSIDGSGNAGEAMWSGGPITFTFDATALGNLPTHVGIVWTDGDNPITFTAYDENDVLLGTLVGSHADGNYGGGTAEDRFYGAINAGGIHKIVISSAGAIEVDHLQYGFGAVPEPATIAALGLGALSLLRKRRKK